MPLLNDLISFAMKRLLFVLSFSILAFAGFSQQPVSYSRDIDNLLLLRDRVPVVNDWLDWRLDHIIPDLLQREGIDMWIVMCREINEDPIFFTLVPEPVLAARRLTILVFHNSGSEKGAERYCIGPMDGGYINAWTDRSKGQMENLADLIKRLNPNKIGINVSPTHRSADGLSSSLRDRLVVSIGPEYAGRLVSAEKVAIGWIETRSPAELSMYRHICGIAHDLINEFFSNGVIIPDVTTTEDLSWWIWQRMEDIGVEPWFEPYVTIQRHPEKALLYKDKPQVVRRGDLLHCDIGIKYLRLCTDMQWHAYVLNIGESDAPEGLKIALGNAVRLAEVFMGEFKEGKSGHEIAASTLKRASNEGLRAQLYTHPIGFFGHSAGMSVDTRPAKSAPEEMPEVMKYPLFLNTCYAIEFSATTAVREWDGVDVVISFEENAAMTNEGCKFIDGNQTKLILIK